LNGGDVCGKPAAHVHGRKNVQRKIKNSMDGVDDMDS
jgi:hypothetical protein